MKKLFLTAIAVVLAVLSANAQVKIESPHPDLDIKITRCAYASGTVVIDMVITNFGIDERLCFESGGGYSTDFITMYDDEGNSYNGNNSDIKFGFPNSGLRSGQRNLFTFPQDIPLKFRFQFTKIDDNATKFSLIKIRVASNGAMALSDGKLILIRNLEWEK